MQSESPDTSVPHCPHCLQEVGPRWHFCTACGMPITSHSTIGPMEQVWAFGWLINRLLSQRPTAFTVVGVWFMALPSIIVILTLPVTLVVAAAPGTGVETPMLGLVSLVVAGCYLLLAVRVTLSFAGHRRTQAKATSAPG